VKTIDELFTTATSSIVSSDRILYTPSAFARSSLLHLQEIGNLETKKLTHLSVLAFNRTFFNVVSGSSVLNYNGKEHEIKKDSCVFINCKTPYSHATDPSNLWTLRWIHFYGPPLSSIYDKYCERGGWSVFMPDISTKAEMDKVCWIHTGNSLKGGSIHSVKIEIYK